MFLKILKKDLKRKKVMNVILFIFMLTAGTLISSSTNLLYSTITAVDYFMEKSKVADLISLTNSDQEIIQTIEKWAETSPIVREYQAEDTVMLDENKITASTGKVLTNTGNLAIMMKPEKYNLIFDADGEDFELNQSEAAVPVSIQKKMGLKTGDKVTIEINGLKKEFTVSHIFKDVVLGAELMGMKRIILSEKDFRAFYENAGEKEYVKFWSFFHEKGYQNDELKQEFSNLLLPTYTIMEKDVISTAYILDLVLAAIMIIVSIFLILISFLILRFTIVFTVMEDYRQIGVMKAIGLKSSKVRGIYSAKYFMLSSVSGTFGLILSLPVAGLMKQNISEYILLKQTPMNFLISLVSILAEIGVTMLFCNYSTGKIKKISAIDAIRQGNTGERFKNVRKLKLYHRKRMKLPLFLACSDIISDLKKFIILMITFVLGTAIIIIPNNVITTLSSDESISLFGYSDSDFYIRDAFIGNQQDALNRMKEYSDEFEEKGFQVKLKADLITNGKLYNADMSKSLEILGFQGIGTDTEQYDYLEGTAPQLLNEIAVTEKAAKALRVGIGDRVRCEMQGENKEYIITALFQCMNSLGNDARLPEAFTAESSSTTSITISGTFTEPASDRELQLKELKKEFPELDIKNASELLRTFIGDTIDQLGAMKNLILAIVLGINFLITLLLLRMLISKEAPEIAILKSLGFHSVSIRLWQILRIGMILAVSILIGTVLANTTGNYLTAGVFKVMGMTRLKLLVEPLQVYLIYPVLLFVITMLAVLCSLGQLKKINVWELNNQE